MRGFTCLTLFKGLLFSAIFFGSVVTSGQEMPPMTITIYDSSATEGYYFMSPYRTFPPYNYVHPQLILDRWGRTVWYRVFSGPTGNTTTSDFKIQPNGLITYYSYAMDFSLAMDSTFQVVDSLNVVGFPIDMHDLQFIPDSHYLMLAKESRYMNLSAYHWFGPNHNLPGGVNAEVIGAVIQEFDANENLVWEWKALDHFDFSDVDSIWLGGPNKVDWTHANAVERDADGNILLSSRHFNEITKINRQNGNIIWRLGGKKNEFTFPNDPIRFKGQHDIRRIANGHITLFDNGRYHYPERARALEYSLNESSKIATLEWEYLNDSSMYSIALGNFQTLANGNKLVDFGSVSGDFVWLVVVKPDKSKIMQIYSPDGHVSYRAFNYPALPWGFHRPLIDCYQSGSYFVLEAEVGYTEYHWSTGANTQSIPVIDTGYYWVFVPHGGGYICSDFIKVTNLADPCPHVGLTEPILPQEITLHCNPNPVTNTATILFYLPVKVVARVIMSDLSGKTVFEVEPTSYSAGKHILSFSAEDISKGIYMFSLQTHEQVLTLKVIVL